MLGFCRNFTSTRIAGSDEPVALRVASVAIAPRPGVSADGESGLFEGADSGLHCDSQRCAAI